VSASGVSAFAAGHGSASGVSASGVSAFASGFGSVLGVSGSGVVGIADGYGNAFAEYAFEAESTGIAIGAGAGIAGVPEIGAASAGGVGGANAASLLLLSLELMEPAPRWRSAAPSPRPSAMLLALATRKPVQEPSVRHRLSVTRRLSARRQACGSRSGRPMVSDGPSGGRHIMHLPMVWRTVSVMRRELPSDPSTKSCRCMGVGAV